MSTIVVMILFYILFIVLLSGCTLGFMVGLEAIKDGNRLFGIISMFISICIAYVGIKYLLILTFGN